MDSITMGDRSTEGRHSQYLPAMDRPTQERLP
jgi:hypothetical protein